MQVEDVTAGQTHRVLVKVSEAPVTRGVQPVLLRFVWISKDVLAHLDQPGWIGLRGGVISGHDGKVRTRRHHLGTPGAQGRIPRRRNRGLLEVGLRRSAGVDHRAGQELRAGVVESR